MLFTVIAEYKEQPAEGINVVSKTLIDDLRAAGHEVRIFSPMDILRKLPLLIADRAPVTVFTHGPGVRTVLVSKILRLFSPTRIIWIATRPDIARCPSWLKGGRTAHVIICNRKRVDLGMVAFDAQLIEQPIGVAPERMHVGAAAELWPQIRAKRVPIAVHAGHLRRTRGLERMCEIKAKLGDRIEIVVIASPYFEPAPGLAEELSAAGVHVERGFISNMAEVYQSSDIYLFPAPIEAEGAIELPLSVLEALSCSRPVITTPFGALPKALAGVEGVRFAASADFAGAVVDWVNDPDNLPPPDGLPDHLNAHRIADRLQEACGDIA